MRVSLDGRDLATYPFLKESQQLAGNIGDSIPVFLEGVTGKRAASFAADRVIEAVTKPLSTDPPLPPSDALSVKIEIASYAIARILVSCAKDRQMIERLAKYEANRAYRALINEDSEKRVFLYQALGMDIAAGGLPVVQYIPLAAHLPEDRWRLVNRSVIRGIVAISAGEKDELLREQIRVLVRSHLPLPVPERICQLLAAEQGRIQAAISERMLEEYGVVETGAYPPCISAILEALAAGRNLTHSGRFSVTAFLNNIGMDPAQIIRIYGRSPDFDEERTSYQVGHISGRGGTEYTAPSCAWMKTNSLCIRPDRTCEKVQHPLTYYKVKKRRISSGSPVSHADDLPPAGTHNHKESNKGDQVPDSGPEDRGKGDEKHDKRKHADQSGDDIQDPGFHDGN
jgi:DNA primase large subunit